MSAPRTARSAEPPAVGERLVRFAFFERDEQPLMPSGTAPAPRRKRFVASDETVDRYGDVIRASGWQLANFRKNPVLLFGHNSRALPIGKVDPITVEGTKLVGTAEFTPPGMNPFADVIFDMVDQGYLNAVSVGFNPLDVPKAMFDEDGWLSGFEFIAQELLELSVVPVPANPNALQLARSFVHSADDFARLYRPVERSTEAARVAAQRRSHLIALSRLRHRSGEPAVIRA